MEQRTQHVRVENTVFWQLEITRDVTQSCLVGSLLSCNSIKNLFESLMFSDTYISVVHLKILALAIMKEQI